MKENNTLIKILAIVVIALGLFMCFKDGSDHSKTYNPSTITSSQVQE